VGIKGSSGEKGSILTLFSKIHENRENKLRHLFAGVQYSFLHNNMILVGSTLKGC
jgi:hypothetical protein